MRRVRASEILLGRFEGEIEGEIRGGGGSKVREGVDGGFGGLVREVGERGGEGGGGWWIGGGCVGN